MFCKHVVIRRTFLQAAFSIWNSKYVTSRQIFSPFLNRALSILRLRDEPSTGLRKNREG